MSKKIKNIALVSAAGAGKTRALTHRFLFLYLHKTNFPLDSLYGITFTNEATFEMKERILNYLDLLITGSAKGESEKAIVEYFSKIFSDIKERAKRKKRYLLNNLSDLHISTFHSLFASFLSSVPFAAGILPGYEIIDETQEEILFDGVLDAFFEEIFTNKDYFKTISELMEQQETRLKKSIKDIFRNIAPWIDFLEYLINKEKTIETDFAKQEQKFLSTLGKFRNFVDKHEPCAYTKGTNDINKHFAGFLSKINEFIHTKDVQILHGSVFGVDLLSKRYFQSFLNNLGEHSNELVKIIEDLKIDTDKYLKFLSDQQVIIYLKPILKIYAQFQREKQKKNFLTFDDIEKYTLQAFKNNPEPDYLYFKIGAELRHLMIDEFQDTSHRQLEILDPLISEIISVDPTEKSLFYVGDPYQAIFRWRGGTPALFHLLVEKYRGKIEDDELIINYRSKEDIINFVNKILDKNDKAKPGNTGGWIRVENLGEFDEKQVGQENIRARAVTIVKELYERHGYEYSDIAILVRTNNFGVAMADELTKNRIPNVSKSRTVILNDNDVRFMLNLLKFLDDPENDFALMHILLSSVFNLKEETLMHLQSARKTLFMGLCDLHPEWKVSKKLKNLLSIVHFCNPYELVYRIYKELKLNVSYSLATLLDVALEYTRNGFTSLSSFVDWLEKAGKAIEVKEIYPEGVRILTVHKAKGLEFEVVIIPETNWPLPRYENRQLLFTYEEGGAKPERIYWRGYGKYFEKLKIAEQERLKNDELNLLYVALTRSKNGIYILGFNYLKSGMGFWIDRVSEKVGTTSYSIGEVIEKQRLKKEKEEEKPYGAISEEPLIIKEERSLYSPTERGVEIIDASRRWSMEFGSIVHQALSRVEWLDNIEVQSLIDDVILYIKNIYVRIPEEAEAIDAKLKTLLMETLTDPDLRFLFYKGSQSKQCRNELSIYFEEKKKDVSVHIDRLIIESDKVTIIDYKTGGEKPEYRHQLKVYKNGVRKIFPESTIEAFLVYLDREKGKKIVSV